MVRFSGCAAFGAVGVVRGAENVREPRLRHPGAPQPTMNGHGQRHGDGHNHGKRLMSERALRNHVCSLSALRGIDPRQRGPAIHGQRDG
jgi:hypothetical protein